MSNTSVNSIVKSIQNGQIAPIYYLVGKEKYFHDLIIRTLEQEIFPDPSAKSLNLSLLYGTESTLAEVISASLAYPMLSNKKLVIVRDLNRLDISDPEYFEKYLKHPLDSTCLVLSSEETGKTKIFQTIKKIAITVECNPIRDNNIFQFLKERSKQSEIAIEDPAIHFLIDHIGANLLNLDLELEKVRNYKGDQSLITVDDLSVTTGISKETNVFALQGALARRQLTLSLQISKKLLDSGENINAIVGFLFGFFKRAVIVASLRKLGKSRVQITAEMKLPEYQLKDPFESMVHFSESQIDSIIGILHEMDLAIKSSSIKPDAAIQMLCYKICRI
ncbi:MAG: DNA polymerase III subunit delta [Calditrichaceae bacterium]